MKPQLMRVAALAMVAVLGCGGGAVAPQRTSVAGLSAVEAFPATAFQVTLWPNPLLIDGNTGVSAGINVGFGPTLFGDVNARDVGVMFADVVTSVNTIYVWFDRPFTPEVGQALAGAVAVYQSDDNSRWTAVPTALWPMLSGVENRIEIAVVQVQAKYLKVSLRPLPPGVTTDAAYQDIFVTEVQFLLQEPTVMSVRGGSTRVAGVRNSPGSHPLASRLRCACRRRAAS